MNTLADNILLFARTLRAAGLDVHHGRALDALHAVEAIGVRRRTDVHATLRALLVHRADDLATFDRAFDLFFRARPDAERARPSGFVGHRKVVARPLAGTPATIEEAGTAGSAPLALAVGAYSPAEVSRTKDFAEFSDAELEAARRLLMRMPWQLGTRHTRRWRPAGGGKIHLAPLLRRNVMRGGELLELPRRRRRDAPRPLVVIGDVSGSMDRYSRVLLQFAYGLARGSRRVEAFVFATRLTRITRHLADRQLARIGHDVRDWGGGTRIGDSLRTFNTHWARRVMRNGPVVVVLSDGWDRGDPALVGRELARLRRSCRRLIWLNPLLGSPRYEPSTRGMQAALAHVDDFLPAHNLASLEQLATHLLRHGSHRHLHVQRAG